MTTHFSESKNITTLNKGVFLSALSFSLFISCSVLAMGGTKTEEDEVEDKESTRKKTTVTIKSFSERLENRTYENTPNDFPNGIQPLRKYETPQLLELMQKADSGDAESCYILGSAMYEDEETGADIHQAIHYLESAASKGHPEANKFLKKALFFNFISNSNSSITGSRASTGIKLQGIDQNTHPTTTAQPNIAELQKAIHDIAQTTRAKIMQHQDIKEAVIILGPTGAGKTTLVHHLAGIPLTVQHDSDLDEYHFNPKEFLPGSNISHTTAVGTKLPSAWCDKAYKTAYWDCPGFGDPRGIEGGTVDADIVNSFSIHQLFTNYQRAKVLLAVPKELITVKRGTEFFELLNNMTELLPDDNQLQKGLSLVITKLGGNINPHSLLSKVLDEAKKSKTLLTSRAASLFQSLVDNKDHISSLPCPHEEGEYQFNKKSILSCIEAAEYMDNPHFTIKAKAESQNYISALAESLNKSIANNIRLKGPLAILYHYRNMINTHVESVGELRKKLKNLENEIAYLQDKDNFQNNPQGFADSLTKFFDASLIKRSIESLSFLKKIHGDVEYHITEWGSALSGPKEQIQKLMESPKLTHLDGISSLKGPIIGIDDIKGAIGGSEHPLHNAEITALHTFLIDKSLTSHETSLKVQAPLWKVQKERTVIDLSGKAGEDFTNRAEDGRTGTNQGINGKNGLPGLPGGNGGNFEGYGDLFFDLKNLTIKSNGGQGGKGQDGGNGANGQNGIDAEVDEVNKRGISVLTKREKFKCNTMGDYIEKGAKLFLTLNEKFKETYESAGTPGENGGNSGQGGQGGLGGQPGKISLTNINGDASREVNTEDNVGMAGPSGAKGQPGKGGKNGKIYYGAYISEYVGASVRGINENIGDTVGDIVKEGALEGAAASLGAAFAKNTPYKAILASEFKVVAGGVFNESTKQTIKIGAQVITTKGGEETAKGILRTAVTEGGKATIKVGGVPTAAGIAAGLGIGIAVQGVLSAISAPLSSGWIVPPVFLDQGSAPDGQ